MAMPPFQLIVFSVFGLCVLRHNVSSHRNEQSRKSSSKLNAQKRETCLSLSPHK